MFGRSVEVLKRLPEGKCSAVEVGVYRGEMSEELLLSNKDLTLHLVDSWGTFDPESEYCRTGDHHSHTEKDVQDAYYKETLGRMEFFGARAVVLRKTSTEAAKDFRDGAIDMVFLDADHSYAGMMADLDAWMPKVKPGGWIGGHDFDNPTFPEFGVKKALEKTFAGAVELGTDMTWFVKVGSAA